MLLKGVNINPEKGITNGVSVRMHSVTMPDEIDFGQDADGKVVQFDDMVGGREYHIVMPYSVNVTIKNIDAQ